MPELTLVISVVAFFVAVFAIAIGLPLLGYVTEDAERPEADAPVADGGEE